MYIYLCIYLPCFLGVPRGTFYCNTCNQYLAKCILLPTFFTGLTISGIIATPSSLESVPENAFLDAFGYEPGLATMTLIPRETLLAHTNYALCFSTINPACERDDPESLSVNLNFNDSVPVVAARIVYDHCQTRAVAGFPEASSSTLSVALSVTVGDQGQAEMLALFQGSVPELALDMRPFLVCNSRISGSHKHLL